MLKQVLFFDLLIGIASSLLMQLFLKQYTLVFLAGLLAASMGFLLSGYIYNSILVKRSLKHGMAAPLINLSKVFLISIIGVLLFNNNINNVIAYALGFTSHFLALILYGIKTLIKERK